MNDALVLAIIAATLSVVNIIFILCNNHNHDEE